MTALRMRLRHRIGLHVWRPQTGQLACVSCGETR